ncbi:MAG: shikimate dehydrogenase [Alphaproteobacteria bacterium]|jgi:shikimate dehydrogenase|nr:shikimate dehydrogenase [Alphaproteobacteria bacterium]
MSATTEQPLYGVLGYPVSHSRSPALHCYWLKKYAGGGVYLPLAVPPAALPVALKSLVAGGFQGFNVTIPHKEAICPLLDVLDVSAQQVGAVNTVVISHSKCKKVLTGYNTDVTGYAEGLVAGATGLKLMGASAAIIGSGGAARAVALALKQHGVATIIFLARNERAATAIIGDCALGAGAGVLPFSPQMPPLSVDLVVNTTPLGMKGQDALHFPWQVLSKSCVISDCVYNPLQTTLLREAVEHGHTPVDGLGMFLGQAAVAFALWTGIKPEIDETARRLALGQTAG